MSWGRVGVNTNTENKLCLPKGSKTPSLKINLSILYIQIQYNFASFAFETTITIKSVLYSNFCTVNLKGKHAGLCHHLKYKFSKK